MGNSTLHVDRHDCYHRKGSCILYLNPWEHTFHGTDLLIFERSDGGKAVRLKTMIPGWTCLVFLNSSKQLHGSVFPPMPSEGYTAESFSKPGCEAIRVACYSLCHAVKFARIAGSNNGRSCQGLLKLWKETISKQMSVSSTKERIYKHRHLPVYEQVERMLITSGISVNNRP